MTGGAAYTTYFDQRFLARGLVMMRSLRRHDPDAIIFPLCLDPLTYETVAGLADPQIVPIAHGEVLAFEARLAACADRPRWAYYGTHKPITPSYVLARWPGLARVTHIDADTWFFSPPSPLFGEAPEASILVSPHRFPPAFDWAARFGQFNAGFISWRNDANGRACLAGYVDDCLSAVEPDEVGGRFMNQGYLTGWPDRYPAVHVLQHPGGNLAPWNVGTHVLRNRRAGGADHVTVDGAPLIFFHFSQMHRDAEGCWRTQTLEYGEANLAVALVKIFRPYFRAVDDQIAALSRLGIQPLEIEPPGGQETYHYLT